MPDLLADPVDMVSEHRDQGAAVIADQALALVVHFSTLVGVELRASRKHQLVESVESSLKRNQPAVPVCAAVPLHVSSAAFARTPAVTMVSNVSPTAPSSTAIVTSRVPVAASFAAAG